MRKPIGIRFYGRFEIDERQSQVRHFIEGSLFAFETGVTLARAVSFENDVLTRTVTGEACRAEACARKDKQR